jgi:solute carrier family 35 protein F5
MIPLVPVLLKRLYDDRSKLDNLRGLLQRMVGKYKLLRDQEGEEDDDLPKPDNTSQHSSRSRSPAAQMLLEDNMGSSQRLSVSVSKGHDGLTLVETARLSFEFCILWVSSPNCKLYVLLTKNSVSGALEQS